MPDVYYWYSDYIVQPIVGEQLSNFNEFKKFKIKIIKETIKEKCSIPMWNLIENIHKEKPGKTINIERENCEITIYDLEQSPEILK